MNKTVVELFAGVGGFRIGLERASKDYDFVWANQWEPARKTQDAYNCYCEHFGTLNHSNEDINRVPKEKIKEHTLLVGGFPCQDYSVASTGAKGIQGKKGVLWWDIHDILTEKEPPFVLLENVDRLLKSPSKQRGRDFAVILACFKRLGYNVEWRVINAADYGFAQRRRRIFIFAYKDKTRYSNALNKYSIDEVLDEKGFFESIFPTRINDKHVDRVKRFVFDSVDLVDVSDNFSEHFYNSGTLIGDKLYTRETEADYSGNRVLLKDILESNVESKYYLNGELDDWKYMKGSKRIERTHKDGHKYVFSEGQIAFPDPIDRPARTMLTSESSKNRSTHIIRDPETDNLRKLTPVECERLNGFPDNWTNTGMSERFRYFCMGNALVVNLVEIMGTKISIIIDGEK